MKLSVWALSGLVMSLFITGCSGEKSAQQSGDLSNLANVRPAPALDGTVEIGGGLGTSAAPTAVARAGSLIRVGYAPSIMRVNTTGTTSDPLIKDDPNPGDPTVAPLSTANPATTLGRSKPNGISHPDQGPLVAGLTGRPFPTGKWYKGFFYVNDGASTSASKASSANENARTIYPFPNAVMLSDSDNRIDVQFPKKRFVAKPGDTETNLSNPYLRDYVLYNVQPDDRNSLRLSYKKDADATSPAPPILARKIDRYDELTIRTSWLDTTGASDQRMQLIAAVGSPFITVLYNNLRPQIMFAELSKPTDSGQVTIKAVAEAGDWDKISTKQSSLFDSAAAPTLTGKAFRIVYRIAEDNGQSAPKRDKVALLFFSAAVTLNWDAAKFAYVVAEPFKGVLRAAYVDDKDEGDPKLFPERENLLSQYANDYPVSSEVLTNYAPGGKAEIQYRWTSNKMNTATSGTSLMMMAFEKTHLTMLSNPQLIDLTYPSSHGTMKAVVGLNWIQKLTVPDLFTGADTSDADTIWLGKKRIKVADYPLIRRILSEDLEEGKNYLPHCTNDSYICGKHLFRFTRMALIAHEIGDATLRNQAVDFMKLTIQPWFDGQDPTDGTYKDKGPLEKNNFVYDTTYSGTVTVRGLVGREQDYGNALYNDHMFHYGYFIYAAAVIARFDQQNTWLNNYKEKVNTLVRDIANPSLDDEHYPVMRAYDWFLMRNAADSGPNTNGPNTESSSESINADYALALWGLAINNPQMQALGAIMTAGEIRSAQAWYQITPDNSVFKGLSREVVNVKLQDGTTETRVLKPENEIAMGILRHNIQEFNTFFAKLLYARVGIQILPVTPISDYVLSRTWATAHAAALRNLAIEMSNQIDNVAGDGPDADKLLNNPKKPDAWCSTPEVRPTNASGAATCAGSIRVLYAWRQIILSASGLNDPNRAYEDTAKYRAKVVAQTESFRVRTMGADAGLDQTENSPTRGQRLIYPNGLGNLDLLRSDAVPGTDVNVLAWLSSLK